MPRGALLPAAVCAAAAAAAAAAVGAWAVQQWPTRERRRRVDETTAILVWIAESPPTLTDAPGERGRRRRAGYVYTALCWSARVEGVRARVWRDGRSPAGQDAMLSRPRAPAPRARARLISSCIFIQESHTRKTHATWALAVTARTLRSAGALRADLQALVIQVLHVPDTPRPVSSL